MASPPNPTEKDIELSHVDEASKAASFLEKVTMLFLPYSHSFPLQKSALTMSHVGSHYRRREPGGPLPRPGEI